MFGALGRAYGWLPADILKMPICLVEAMYDEAIRTAALEDVRSLDVAAASQSAKGYTSTRDRLLAVHARGMKAVDDDGRLILTPQEAKEERQKLRGYLRTYG